MGLYRAWHVILMTHVEEAAFLIGFLLLHRGAVQSLSMQQSRDLLRDTPRSALALGVMTYFRSKHQHMLSHRPTLGRKGIQRRAYLVQESNGLMTPTITSCFPSRGLGELAFARRVNPFRSILHHQMRGARRSSYSGLAGYSVNIGGGG